MALEEISWGQRVFAIEPGEFFRTYSDQNEINLHNVMQQYLSQEYALTQTRRLAALVLFLYGVIFPVLNRFVPFAIFFANLGWSYHPRAWFSDSSSDHSLPGPTGLQGERRNSANSFSASASLYWSPFGYFSSVSLSPRGGFEFCSSGADLGFSVFTRSSLNP